MVVAGILQRSHPQQAVVVAEVVMLLLLLMLMAVMRGTVLTGVRCIGCVCHDHEAAPLLLAQQSGVKVTKVMVVVVEVA